MNPRIIAALFAAAALPVAAETATPRVDQRQAGQEARAQQGAKLTARERANLAKAQNKQGRKAARHKQDQQKKAPAG